MSQEQLLSPSREKRLYNAILHLNPIGYWPEKEVGGSLTLNHAPRTRYLLNATNAGATIGQPGKASLGKAYSFDGTSSKLAIDTTGSILNNLTAVSFIWLMNLSGYGGGGNARIFHKGPAAVGYLDVSCNSGNGAISFSSTWVTTNEAVLFTMPAFNKWHLCIMTYSGVVGENPSFFADNTPLSIAVTTASAGARGADDNNLALGNRTIDTARSVQGLLQHQAIIDRIITPGEISRLNRIAGFV